MIYEPSDDSELIKKYIKEYSRNKKVLEIGTGSGILAKEAKKYTKDVTASDINKECLKNFKEIKKITEAKSVIENINEDTSREDIQEAVKTIKEAWRNAKVNAYKARLMHVGYSMENLISKANVIGERVQEKASELNLDELNSLLSEYNIHVENAETKYTEAKALFEQETEPGRINELVKEVKQKIKEANEELKQSREILRKMMAIIKQNNKEISLTVEEDSQ